MVATAGKVSFSDVLGKTNICCLSVTDPDMELDMVPATDLDTVASKSHNFAKNKVKIELM